MSQIRKMQKTNNNNGKKLMPNRKPAGVGEVVGLIPTDLRLKMKDLTDTANAKRGEMANLSLQRTDLRLRIQQLEAEEADRFRAIVQINAELETCRVQINEIVKFEENVNYHVDLNTGEVSVLPPPEARQ